MNNERSTDSSFFLDAASLQIRSAPVGSIEKSRNKREREGRKRCTTKREGTVRHSGGSFLLADTEVYALKAFWYYANAIKRREGNMARCRSPWSPLRDTFRKTSVPLPRRTVIGRYFHGKRRRIVFAKGRAATSTKSFRRTYDSPYVKSLLRFANRFHDNLSTGLSRTKLRTRCVNFDLFPARTVLSICKLCQNNVTERGI